jgi:hypothetical protein
MGRRKDKTTLVTPLWIEALRTNFLSAAFGLMPSARDLLATKGYRGEITSLDWAREFDVQGTWIEEWAERTLKDWKAFPDWVRNDPVTGALVEVFCNPPEVAQTKEDQFSYSTSGNLPSPYAIGVVAGGRLPNALMGEFDQLRKARRDYREELQTKEQATTADQRRVADARIGAAKARLEKASQAAAEFDPWDYFVKARRADLDKALSQHRKEAASTGASREIHIPRDLDLKLEVAALYIFGRQTPEEIGKRRGVGRERYAVNRWLREILPLLDLKPRPPGWQRKPPL